MNAMPSRSASWMCYILAVGSLALTTALLLGRGGGRAAKHDQKRVAKLVDDLANRNSAPQLVGHNGNLLPLFPAAYDWKEQKRVQEALRRLENDQTAEVWEEMIKKADDPRYALTFKNNSGVFAEDNRTVGRLCRQVAYDELVGVFRQHLPDNPPDAPEMGEIDLDVGVYQLGNLVEWREKRKDKTLSELQIEVCEQALKELAKAKGVPRHEKVQARKKIKAEIGKLRKTNRPILVRSDILGSLDECYSAEEGKEFREKLRRKR
ncbi:MAG TPA: hypothetical protein VG013_01340 [Gemmataceae bacterium]|nr:hypothetical protein [Gemmataceae bacterium]